MLVGVLGILKAGGCYIPVDPEYPQDRINFMLQDSAAPIMVTQSSVLDSLTFTDPINIIQVDTDVDKIAQQLTSSPSISVNQDDLAYIIFTSGSTGKPKGVMVPHGAATNFIQSMAEMPGLNNADRLLAVTTLSFDIAVLELYLPYRTGDIVKFTPSGDIDYIERMDNQVKVRGFRIELGEIESVLSNLEGVEQAVVTVIEEFAGEQSLAAYVILNAPTIVTFSNIRQELRQYLPGYMLPQYIVEVEEFPLTPNGKINRKQLSLIAQDKKTEAELKSDLTLNPLETKILAVWQEIFKVKSITINDDFFKLGGHSMLAIRLVQTLNKQIEECWRIQDIFSSLTIKQLAELTKSKIKYAGENVCSLFMLDARLPKEHARNWALYFRHQFGSLKLNTLPKTLLGGFKKIKKSLSSKLKLNPLTIKTEELSDEEIILLRSNIYYNSIRGFESNANIYAGDGHLFIAESFHISPWISVKSDLGWSKYIKGKIEVHSIPGRHIETLHKPNVELIAKIINKTLP